MLLEDLEAGERPPDANPAAIAAAYVVSAYPSAERERAQQATGRLREDFPNALTVSVFLPGMSIQPELPANVGNADRTVGSFVEAVQVCLGAAAAKAA